MFSQLTVNYWFILSFLIYISYVKQDLRLTVTVADNTTTHLLIIISYFLQLSQRKRNLDTQTNMILPNKKEWRLLLYLWILPTTVLFSNKIRNICLLNNYYDLTDLGQISQSKNVYFSSNKIASCLFLYVRIITSKLFLESSSVDWIISPKSQNQSIKKIRPHCGKSLAVLPRCGAILIIWGKNIGRPSRSPFLN